MSRAELIRDLHAQGIRLSVSGGSLDIDAPPGTVTPDLLERLKRHKDDIIRHLVAEARIRAWLDHIRETDPEIIAEVLAKCSADPEALAYFLGRAAEVPPVRRVVGRTVGGAEVVVTEGRP